MRKTIFISIFIFLLTFLAGAGSALGQQSYSYSVGLRYHYEEEVLDLEWMKIIKGPAPNRLIQMDRGYLAKVISFTGNTLYSFRFDMPFVSSAPPPEWFDPITGEQIYFPEGPAEPISDIIFSFVIPYFSRAQAIEFYSPQDNLLLSVNVSEYHLCQDDLANCEDILIRHHQQEIDQLAGIPGFEEEIQIRQSGIEELQENKSFKEKIEEMLIKREAIEEETEWKKILIVLVIIIIIAFFAYFVLRKYLIRQKSELE